MRFGRLDAQEEAMAVAVMTAAAIGKAAMLKAVIVGTVIGKATETVTV
jgi:hypothetical protein